MDKKLYDFRTVSAKLSSKDFSEFKAHCDKKYGKDVKISKIIKDLIKQEMEESLAVNLAGKNEFSYNPAKDNFSWRAILDKGIISYIEDDLSSEFLIQLKDALDVAIEERNTFIQKRKENSVAISGKIVRRGM